MNWYKIAKEEQLDLFSKNPPPPTMPETMLETTTPEVPEAIPEEEPNIYYLGFSKDQYSDNHRVIFSINGVKWAYSMDSDSAKKVKSQARRSNGKALGMAKSIAKTQCKIDANGYYFDCTDLR